MNFNFGVGTVVAVNSSAKDSTGRPTPSIGVKSQEAGGLIDIPMSAAAWEQTMPIVGYRVFYIQFDTFQYRVLKFWGNDEDFIRKGEFALNDGEVFIQSPSGLGYFKIDQDGRVQIVGGDMTSTLEHGDNGTVIRSPHVTLVSVAGAFIELVEGGSISLRREDADGNVTSSIEIDQKDNIMVETSGDVGIKARNIYLDGKVYLGSGATDPQLRKAFGAVVTGAPVGTHPTDFVTGAPIPGSTSVKVSG